MARVLYVWDRLRGSFWFVPSLFAAVALGLAFAMLATDRALEGSLPQALLLYTGGAEGARSLLSAVAGSIITVVGLAFSITVVALQLAAAQLGPRLLRNFVRDPGNQIVLGTLVGTFVYCLIVLRAVRGGNGLSDDAFVPHLSVTVGVVLAMLSIGVLIYFIHHAARSMQADNVIATVMKDLDGAIDVVFPDRLPSTVVGPDPVESPTPPPEHETARVESAGSGYVQSIDAERLTRLARAQDLVLWVTCRPGDFVSAGDVIGRAWPRARADETVQRTVPRAVVLGIERTMLQDVLFGFEQLAEIAAHALSSSLRDPITATRCIDRLGEAIDRLAARRPPRPVRRDAEGCLRLVVRTVTLEEAVGAAFDMIRAHARGSRLVGVHLLETFARLLAKHRRHDLRAGLLAQAFAVRRAADALADPLDQEAIRCAFENLCGRVSADATHAA
jgi:uncharacterized membrane protein